MAILDLYVGEDQLLPSTSGIGFYGQGGFGDPILLSAYNGRTFVTNISGVVEAFECNNNRWTSASGVVVGQAGSGILLTSLPNTLATLNARFSHVSAVKTQSAKFYVYDGTSTGGLANKTNNPSGLTSLCAEIRHNDETQIDNGLGDALWQDIKGATNLDMISSPGTSGLRPNDSLTVDGRHDWYIAMTVTPNEFGNKLFGILFELEFL